MSKTLRTTLGLVLAMALAAPRADAFCGFYVSGAGSAMFNDATEVVLMRRGTRTVLSMQNHYQGPPEAFALVIPVPTVLRKKDVKILADDVFDRIDALGSPRLVEYWEKDPCEPRPDPRAERDMLRTGASPDRDPGTLPRNFGVKVEAEFEVGEYQISILSAKDAAGLDGWLRAQKYQIPPGAEPYLRPYVESGMKFFVAKVDPTKVTFDADHRAVLSPLRFHYDSDEFTLPIRLGLANSSGTQDLIINILAPEQRYEVANHPNVTIPTNFDVKDSVRDNFGEFYAALFDRTLEQHPGAVVTEYAWSAAFCDACPGPALDGSDLATLGADVLGVRLEPWDAILTRLHARYGKDIQDDLVFKAAPPITGGSELLRDDGGKLVQGSEPARVDNFMARYVIRHEWVGPITCAAPRRGRWGGPWAGVSGGEVQAAQDLAFAPRGKAVLAELVRQDVPELGMKAAAPAATKKTGCGCEASGEGAPGGWLLGVGVVGVLVRRRRT